MIVGLTAQSTGTFLVGSGTTLETSGLIGLAHDGTTGTGGGGTLVVDGTATAQNLFLGRGGLLAGNGTVVANVFNQGGIINPGQSPGRLTVDGAFDNTGGTLVLEVQSLGNGQFAVDELVLTDWSRVSLGAGTIQFAFLGDTNPMAFAQAGLFDIGSFLKQADGRALDDSALALFGAVNFSASADAYTFNSLQFNAGDGSFSISVSPVPEPAPLLMGLLGLAMLKLRLRKARQAT